MYLLMAVNSSQNYFVCIPHFLRSALELPYWWLFEVNSGSSFIVLMDCSSGLLHCWSASGHPYKQSFQSSMLKVQLCCKMHSTWKFRRIWKGDWKTSLSYNRPRVIIEMRKRKVGSESIFQAVVKTFLYEWPFWIAFLTCHHRPRLLEPGWGVKHQCKL